MLDALEALHHVAEAPEKFRPFLEGVLRREPERRRSASKCLKWLWRNTDADVSVVYESKDGEESDGKGALLTEKETSINAGRGPPNGYCRQTHTEPKSFCVDELRTEWAAYPGLFGRE